MYISINMHIYIYLHIYICTYICIYIYVYIYICTHTHICIYIYTYVIIFVYIYIYICTYIMYTYLLQQSNMAMEHPPFLGISRLRPSASLPEAQALQDPHRYRPGCSTPRRHHSPSPVRTPGAARHFWLFFFYVFAR